LPGVFAVNSIVDTPCKVAGKVAAGKAGVGVLLRTLLVLMLASGCSLQPPVPPMRPDDISQANIASDPGPYRLGAGDKISVKFYYNHDLDDEVVVRPDGKISLQLIDEVDVAGLTLAEVDEILSRAYAGALKTTSGEYTLCVGDTVAVKSYYAEKLNDEVVIRPDGKISLILVGEISAAGLTPSALQKVLNHEYARFLEQPDVTVIVRDFHKPDLTVTLREAASQKIYVGGEVRTPRVIPLRGGVRLMDALLMAGGVEDSGDRGSVFLLRNAGDRKGLFVVNLDDVLTGRAPDLVLRPYDVVYVPKTALADASTFMRQLYKFLPDQVMVSFPIYLNTQHIKNDVK